MNGKLLNLSHLLCFNLRTRNFLTKNRASNYEHFSRWINNLMPIRVIEQLMEQIVQWWLNWKYVLNILICPLGKNPQVQVVQWLFRWGNSNSGMTGRFGGSLSSTPWQSFDAQFKRKSHDFIGRTLAVKHVLLYSVRHWFARIPKIYKLFMSSSVPPISGHLIIHWSSIFLSICSIQVNMFSYLKLWKCYNRGIRHSLGAALRII